MFSASNDIVKFAVLCYLEEKSKKLKHNHVIQFSTFSNSLYCLYFRNNSIKEKAEIIIPTILNDQDDINEFEVRMLNKNKERVKKECLYLIQDEKEVKQLDVLKSIRSIY